MPAVHLRALSFSHTSAVDLLVDVDLSVGPGWTGLVGANGGGKSTLLGLIAGAPPDRGSVEIDPAGGTVVLCEQTVDTVPFGAYELAAGWDGAAGELRSRLDLHAAQLDRWETLSEGQRKRWQVGAALAMRPDVLLLDEPTNHLDGDARDLLVAALATYDGVGIVVSHDRLLLDQLTTRTIRIHQGVTRLWSGSYSAARAGWEAEHAEAHEAYDRVKKERRALERRLDAQRRASESKAAKYRRRARSSITTGDIDARSAAKAGVHAAGETAALKRQSATRRDLERALAEIDATTIRREPGGEIAFDWVPSPRRIVLRHSGPVAAGGVTLLDDADLAIERTDRVRLAGHNGAGKTTLLRAMVAQAGLPPERVLWLPQDLALADRSRLVREIAVLPAADKGRVFAVASLLGLDAERVLGSEHVSPGEARKLAIAAGIGRTAWVLVLDEPTNHLDLPSIERLERALAAYPGALLMVTHDDVLAEAVTDTTWAIEAGRLRRG